MDKKKNEKKPYRNFNWPEGHQVQSNE